MVEASAEARTWMVDGQLLTNKVTDERLIAAMGAIPRERFVLPQFTGSAYVDEEIPLGNGRMLMEPLVLARLIQSLGLTGSERVLIIGGALGYSAAIVAHLAAEVVMVEEIPVFVEHARSTLPLLGVRNVSLIEAPLNASVAGVPSFDAILIEGAVQQIPKDIIGALREGGKLAYVENRTLRPVAMGGAPTGLGALMMAQKEAGTLTTTVLGEAGVTLLPGFAKATGFQFA